MYTWREGRNLVHQKLQQNQISIIQLHNKLIAEQILRYPGISVFMSSAPEVVPISLSQLLEHEPFLPEVVIFLTVKFLHIPYVKQVIWDS